MTKTRVSESFPDSLQELLPKQLAHLLFVTFHIQTGMGFLGIHFLKKEQERRNMLVRMDVEGDDEENNNQANDDDDANNASQSVNGNASSNHDSKPSKQQKQQQQQTANQRKFARSRRFQRSAIPFIFRTALPYMLQIIAYGNLNFFCMHCLSHDLHRTVRWAQTFEKDAHWMAMTQTPVSPEGTYPYNDHQ